VARSPARRRAAVEHVTTLLRVSGHRACSVPRQHRSTQRKVPRPADDETALTSAIVELAKRYGRYGYRRITALLPEPATLGLVGVGRAIKRSPRAARVASSVAARSHLTSAEKTVLQRQVGHQLLHIADFAAQVLDLARGDLPRRIASKPLLTRLKELLRPAVVEALGDRLTPVQLGDAVLTAQPGRTMRIFSSAEYCLRIRLRMSRTVCSTSDVDACDFCLTSGPFGPYGEPEILYYQIHNPSH